MQTPSISRGVRIIGAILAVSGGTLRTANEIYPKRQVIPPLHKLETRLSPSAELGICRVTVDENILGGMDDNE